jgi:NAD(P)-dependent dehydrogenase (short-subunit alcohol dehydrogenase family)
VLAAHGAYVFGTARDLGKAERATLPVRAAAESGGGGFELIELDLADLSSVRGAAATVIDRGEPLDLVIANAGVMAAPFEHTKDGFELQFGTNVLGHFVLVNMIAPLIAERGRLVMLSSSGHRRADVDLEDPNFEHTPYDPWIAYGRSKTGDALLAVAFDARHRGRGVRATSVHPGGIMTELARHLDVAALVAQREQLNQQLISEGKPLLELKTVPQGAATSVWAGVVANPDAIGGRYCENCHVAEVVPDDFPLSSATEGVRGYAVDPDRAEALWHKAEDMVGERFD